MKCNGTNTPLEMHAMQLSFELSLMQMQAPIHAFHSSLTLCIEVFEGFSIIQKNIKK